MSGYSEAHGLAGQDRAGGGDDVAAQEKHPTRKGWGPMHDLHLEEDPASLQT